MLYHFVSILESWWGPFRLFGSHLFLLSLGAVSAGILVWLVLPRLWKRLPRDRGRANIPGAEKARGKPTGAGILLCLVVTPVLILVTPFGWRQLGLTGCLVLSMLFGFLDDRSATPWGQLRKGLLDGLVAVLAAAILCGGSSVTMWFPLTSRVVEVSVGLYIPLAAALLWFTLNATNCSDGVDGLAGALTLLSLFFLGALLYGVMGHQLVAEYLLVPHYPEGARWAIMLFTGAGALAGYLWHNAEPSRVLMGDAGSRLYGLLVGMAVLASGNPFLVVVVAPVVLVNGGSGMVKLALLRFLRRMGLQTSPPGSGDSVDIHRHVLVRTLHRIRFPLHDHCRYNLGWTNAQVLMRFLLIQIFLTPLLLVILLKIR